ncbi:MAG: amino acid permease [Candidatus Palauibacterales bacterium]|nr:amino acid permease [Candidatus Palauibacterales bacterium]MDP2584476.1 amino acid permease [Candidatus Palauibacterales bacterium]
MSVGIVIGAGILRTPGVIAGYLGRPWLILALWLLGGLVAGLSTLLLSEMAAALPAAGGKYVYAREAWGPAAGFVAGWAELLVARGFSGAAKAVVIAEYLGLLVHGVNVPVAAGTVVLLFTALHLGGVRTGRTFQNATTLVKVVLLLVIAVAGLTAGLGAGGAGVAEAARAAPGAGALTPVTLLGFALAYQNVAFAYYGWEDAAKMAEETRDPGRSLPRILLGGAAAVAILYLLINSSFLTALTPAQMAGSKLVARDAVTGTFGQAAGTFVIVAGLLILVSSLNVNFLGMPRVALALARDGLAPRAFARVGSRGTPVPALLFIAAVLFGLAITGAFEWIIRFMMLVAITVDTVVLAGFFRLRRTRPELHRPMRVPGYPWLPGFALLLQLLVLAAIVGTQPRLALGGGAMLLALVVAGVLTARRRPPPPAGDRAPTGPTP